MFMTAVAQAIACSFMRGSAVFQHSQQSGSSTTQGQAILNTSEAIIPLT
jgi:hypothetical protein